MTQWPSVAEVTTALRDQLERLTAAGVTCTSEPVEFDNSWAFTASDPNGLPIELIQWKPAAEPYTPRP